MTPRSQHILVVGDGIVGSTAAYELARAGHAVDVIGDGGRASPSHGNAGILALSYAMPMATPGALATGLRSLVGLSHEIEVARPLSGATMAWFARFAAAARPGKARRAAAEIHRMARRSLTFYDAFAEAEGVDLGFRRSGWLYAARTRKALESQRRSAEMLVALGITHEVVDAARLPELEPGIGDGFIGGVLYHDDISMDPGHLTTSIQEAGRRLGVTFRTGTVVAAEHGADRSVTAMHTQDGRRHTAEQFLLAAGARSRETAALAGARLSVEPGYGWNVVFDAPRSLATRSLMSIEDHVIVNAGPRTVRVIGGMQFGGGDASSPTAAQISGLRRTAEQLLPEVADLGEPRSAWRGARPMTTDGLPIVERITPNALVVTGHGTLGMTLAPASAERARSLVEAAAR